MADFILIDPNISKPSCATGGRIYNALMDRIYDVSMYTHKGSKGKKDNSERYTPPYYVCITTPKAKVYVMESGVYSFQDVDGNMVYLDMDHKYSLETIDKLINEMLKANNADTSLYVCEKDHLPYFLGQDKRIPYRSSLEIDISDTDSDYQIRFAAILAEELGNNHLDGRVLNFMHDDRILMSKVSTSISVTYISSTEGIKTIKEAVPEYFNKPELTVSRLRSEHIDWEQRDICKYIASDIANLIRGNMPTSNVDDVLTPKTTEESEDDIDYESAEVFIENLLRTNYIQFNSMPYDCYLSDINGMTEKAMIYIRTFLGNMTYALDRDELGYDKFECSGSFTTLLYKWNLTFIILDNFVMVYGKNTDWSRFREAFNITIDPDNYSVVNCLNEKDMNRNVQNISKAFNNIHDRYDNIENPKTPAAINCIIDKADNTEILAEVDRTIRGFFNKHNLQTHMRIRYIFTESGKGLRYMIYEVPNLVTIYVGVVGWPLDPAYTRNIKTVQFMRDSVGGGKTELINAMKDVTKSDGSLSIMKRIDKFMTRKKDDKLLSETIIDNANRMQYILYRSLDDPKSWKYNDDMRAYMDDRGLSYRIILSNEQKIAKYVVEGQNAAIVVYQKSVGINKDFYRKDGIVTNQLVENEADPYATFDDLTYIMDDLFGIAQMPKLEEDEDMDFGDELIEEDSNEDNEVNMTVNKVTNDLKDLNDKFKGEADDITKKSIKYICDTLDNKVNELTGNTERGTVEPDSTSNTYKELHQYQENEDDGANISLSDKVCVDYMVDTEKIRITFGKDASTDDINELTLRIRMLIRNAIMKGTVANFEMKHCITDCHYGQDKEDK